MDDLIEKYHLQPHPEGGYFREIYRSGQSLHSDAVSEKRDAVTQIYFLLLKGQVSRFHRVMHDEIWHLYQGAPLTLIQFKGKKIWSQTIGPGKDNYVSVVQAGTWQAAESTGDYSFMGCTVAPGFDFKDFSFLSDTPKELTLFRQLETPFHRFI